MYANTGQAGDGLQAWLIVMLSEVEASGRVNMMDKRLI